ILLLLHNLPWADKLHGFPGEPDVHELTTFLSRDWLHSTQICLMLEVLECDIQHLSSPTYRSPMLRDTYFSQKLLFCYQECRKQMLSPIQLPRWIDAVGADLASGRQKMIGLIVNQNNSHWTAVVVNFVDRHILFADPMGCPIPPELLGALTWW
ncbi:hypothetical protein B0H21DRAFT_667723, partial [Amylocystis lapponica]